MGKTEEAFTFYKSIFGGEFSMLQRLKDTPDADKLPEHEKEMIMHVALPIGNITLMGTDALESMGHKLQFGDNLSLSISPDSLEDGQRIFTALSEGGKVGMPMQLMFWGAWFGTCTDKFGVQWMVNVEVKK